MQELVKRQDGRDLQKIGWLNLVMHTKAACNLLTNPSCEMKQNRREARLIMTYRIYQDYGIRWRRRSVYEIRFFVEDYA